MTPTQNSLKMVIRYLRWSFLSALVGLLAGVSATVFLFLLHWATLTRDHHQNIIWFLPLAGLAIGLAYHYFGHGVTPGNNLILDEIHDPKKQVPLKMAPMILWSTVVTHLFGGSAGREGTAVQMGASLADQLSSFFKIAFEERKILLVAGAGAGFGAAIGAPWAGMIFGMEVICVGKLRLFALFECFIASFVGYYTSIFLHAPHSVYPKISSIQYEFKTILVVLLFGCLCGILAFLFIRLVHIFEKLLKPIRFSPLKPMLAGLILVGLYYLEGSYSYSGLGIPVIQTAIVTPADWQVPLLKGFFTALTVGSGFKGGEFIPLVFMGTTLGSALSIFFQVDTSLLACLGFAAVFAGASNTPLACSLMAMEIFGPKIGFFALIACFISYCFSGKKGIYHSQKIERSKHHHIFSLWKFFGKRPHRFIKP